MSVEFIEVKRYEDLKGANLPEYAGTWWTPVNDQNFGTESQQWQLIPLKFLKILGVGFDDYLKRIRK